MSNDLLKLFEANGDEFKTCLGINCNSEASFKRCLHCYSTDWFCGPDPLKAEIKTCDDYKAKCYTYIKNKSVQRGCLPAENTDLFVEIKKNPDKSEICINTDKRTCNSKPISLENCVVCDSDASDLCKTRPDLYKNKLCDPFISSKPQGCYLRIVRLNSLLLI